MKITCLECNALSAGESISTCETCGSHSVLVLPSAPISYPKKKKKRKGAVLKEPSKPVGAYDLSDLLYEKIPMSPIGWGSELYRKQSVIVVGDPGVGKTTTLLHSLSSVQGSVLYISSEQSAHMVAAVGRRVGCGRNIQIKHVTSIFEAVEWWDRQMPDVFVLDSLNATTAIHPSGSNASLQEKMQIISERAIENDSAAVVISHVNADGEVSGPRALEHLTDAVIHYRHSEDQKGVRVIEASKNRFFETAEYARYKLESDRVRWLSGLNGAKLDTPSNV